MSGLTSEEMAKAMREISMGKDIKSSSIKNLKDPERLRDFEQLSKEIKAIQKEGMVDLASEWLGEGEEELGKLKTDKNDK